MNSMIHINPFSSNLTRFDPLLGEDWPRGLWATPFVGEMKAAPQIRINLTENDKSYAVRAEIPGVKKEDIKVNVDGNRVSISAEVKQAKEEKKGGKTICSECYEGSTYRSFSLDSNVDESKVQAKYNNGILELTLPKKNGNGARQIQVK